MPERFEIGGCAGLDAMAVFGLAGTIADVLPVFAAMFCAALRALVVGVFAADGFGVPCVGLVGEVGAFVALGCVVEGDAAFVGFGGDTCETTPPVADCVGGDDGDGVFALDELGLFAGEKDAKVFGLACDAFPFPENVGALPFGPFCDGAFVARVEPEPAPFALLPFANCP